MKPFFSFIITCFNYHEFVEQSILSCLQQEAGHFLFEVIVVDDGSSDGSVDIIKKYSSEIKIVRTPNIGVERAFNTGLEVSSGKYVVRVDADDFLVHNYLQQVSPWIGNDADIIYGDYTKLDLQNKVQKRINLPPINNMEIRDRGDFLATGTVIRAELFKLFSMYQNQVENCGLENYELILHCLLANKKFKKINHNLFYYRKHKKNMSEVKKHKIFEYGENLFRDFKLGDYSYGEYHPYFGEKA